MGRIGLDGLLFLFLLGMCVVVAAAFFVEERPYQDVTAPEGGTARVYEGHGVTHAEYETMQAGGDGAARGGTIIWVGLAFGLLQIAFFVTAIAFGGRKANRVGPLRTPIILFGLIYAAVFTAMVIAYRGYTETANPALYLNLPAPTAWMMYGVWGFPLVFMFLYLARFDDWTFTDADLERFKALVAEQQHQEAGD